jgi:hypothetical protein
MACLKEKVRKLLSMGDEIDIAEDRPEYEPRRYK